MGKNKLLRWAEMKSFGNVIEPPASEVRSSSHPLKGRWKSDYFRNENPLVLELGCGKGEYTLGLASQYPEMNFVGIDIKGARIWRGAKTAYAEKMRNVLFIRTRIEFINSFFDSDEADELWITFPDPFPRPKNESRRLTSPPFLNSYREFLRDNGTVHLKTDNNELFRYTLNLVKSNSLTVIASTEDLYSESTANNVLSIRTHYENIFLQEGKKINYLAFSLPKNKVIEYAPPGKKPQ